MLYVLDDIFALFFVCSLLGLELMIMACFLRIVGTYSFSMRSISVLSNMISIFTYHIDISTPAPSLEKYIFCLYMYMYACSMS